MFLSIVSTYIHFQYLVGPPLHVIRAFTRAYIPEIYFFESSSLEELWCQTCIICSINATFVVQAISVTLFFISLQRDTIRFMSGLFLGQSRTSKSWKTKKSLIDFSWWRGIPSCVNISSLLGYHSHISGNKRLCCTSLC